MSAGLGAPDCGQSLLHDLICTPIRRGLPFARAKGSKTRSGIPRDPGRTGTPARNGCAVPKRGLNGAYRVSATHFYRLPRWSAEWRTTTPVPSSKEGDYGTSGLILLGLSLLPSANLSPAPSHRDLFCSAPTIYIFFINWERAGQNNLIE